MKKTLLILSIISGCSFFASAQSLDIGLKGGDASTFLLNGNVSNTGNEENYNSTMSGVYGLHLELNFIGGTGIEFEVISESFNQKYNGTFENDGYTVNNGPYTPPSSAYTPFINNESYTSETKLSEIKFPLLFHFQTIGGFAFEIGPELATISNATYSATFSGEPPAVLGGVQSLSYGVKNDFASSNMLGVIGIGWNFKLIPSGKLYLLADLRFEYGFTDLKGVDGMGQNLASGSDLYSSSSKTYWTYSSYSGTHSAEASLSVGLFYRLNLLPKI